MSRFWLTQPGSWCRPEALAYVFDRFYQDDAARSLKGSGLGLAIVKSLVGVHGGHVEVRNHPNGGAEFCVTLPRR
jgi:signal transduction histidine kinase